MCMLVWSHIRNYDWYTHEYMDNYWYYTLYVFVSESRSCVLVTLSYIGHYQLAHGQRRIKKIDRSFRKRKVENLILAALELKLITHIKLSMNFLI